MAGASDSTVKDERQLEAYHLHLRTDGIAQVTILHGAHVTEAASIELNEAIRELSGGQVPLPIMVDITPPHQTDVDARRYGTTPAALEITRRLALLTNSPVTRMMGNAFLLAKRPPYPTRLFSDEQSAIEWLLQDG